MVVISDVDGRRIEQEVNYEWVPLFCSKCQKMGHKCDNEAKKDSKPTQKTWKPKAKKVVNKSKNKGKGILETNSTEIAKMPSGVKEGDNNVDLTGEPSNRVVAKTDDKVPWFQHGM